jgi:steroid delta-isomerase-like uncharacterized protein
MSSASTSHKTFAHKWFDLVWNQHRPGILDELVAPNCRLHGISSRGPTMEGIAVFEGFANGLRSAFSDIHVDIEDTYVVDDIVTARWTGHLVHTGTFQGIPATNRKLTVKGIAIFRVENDKMVEGWDNWDVLGMHEQIGAVLAIKDEAGNLREIGG